MNTEKDLQESTEQALTIPVVSTRFLYILLLLFINSFNP